MTPSLSEPSSRLRAAVTAASRGLVDRETLVELVALSTVAREHLLVIGPRGTAKSVAVRRMARATGGRYFEYLLGKQVRPSIIIYRRGRTRQPTTSKAVAHNRVSMAAAGMPSQLHRAEPPRSLERLTRLRLQSPRRMRRL